MKCYCDSSKEFSECCEPLILGKSSISSALACMRSRFTAYKLKNIDYLIHTTLPKNRKYYPKKSLENWAKSCIWLKLEIIFHEENTVEFKAFYTDLNTGLPQVHHEHSSFLFEKGNWYFVEGEVK